MAHLTDPQTQLDRLAGAVNDRSHWVFLTDFWEGHVRLVTLALLLLDAGVQDEEMDCGVTEYLNLTTHRQRMLSFLLVPKARVTGKELASLMKPIGLAGEPGFEQDLIILPDPQGGPNELTGVLDEVRKGKVRLHRPELN